MTFKIDNYGRIVHDTTGIVVGCRNGLGEGYIPVTLAHSAVAASLTGTAAETTLASITIPGGLMGPNGAVRITTIWSYTNSANNKFARVKFGGSLYIGATLTTTAQFHHLIYIANRGVTNSQIGAGNNTIPYGSGTAALPISSIDTSQDQVITLTGQLANTGETITLEAYSIEVLPGA